MEHSIDRDFVVGHSIDRNEEILRIEKIVSGLHGYSYLQSFEIAVRIRSNEIAMERNEILRDRVKAAKESNRLFRKVNE